MTHKIRSKERETDKTENNKKQDATTHASIIIKSNQIKSNLFANTKYERKKNRQKTEVKQNEKNNDKLEC